jgi:hypothetical protein
MPKTYQKKTDRTYESQKPQNLPAKFKTGFLEGLDKRTDLARALRQNYDDIVADIGGVDELSHIKSVLVERFVWLEAIVQQIEHQLTVGEIDRSEAISRWVQALNTLIGLSKVLGIERKSGARGGWAAVDALATQKEEVNASP